MTSSSILTLPINTPIELPPRGSWPASKHVFDERSAWAVRAALAAQRPLLVRGEPGVGKSQLARAAAQACGRLFVSEVVHARSEAQDLQWRYDAIGRLGDAQALGATRQTAEEVQVLLDHRRYLSPGSLWWVFDWASAEAQYQLGRKQAARPMVPEGWRPEHGSVLLIDEIDKAEADLPNGLLETLGNGAFSVPWLDEPVKVPEGIPPPLVVITTNEERELPAAFLRRCLVLNLQLPTADADLTELLVARGKIHSPGCHDDVYHEAARQLLADRQAALHHGNPPPGQAEYLDLLRVVVTLERDPARQLALLEITKDFALKKHPAESI